jgi:hypothetical protein
VDNEFDEYRPFGTVKHLGADIDDAPTEFEALIEGTSATDLHEDHRDGLKAIAEVEQLSSPSSAISTLGRHNCVCIEMAQTRRSLPLRLRRMGFAKCRIW